MGAEAWLPAADTCGRGRARQPRPAPRGATFGWCSAKINRVYIETACAIHRGRMSRPPVQPLSPLRALEQSVRRWLLRTFDWGSTTALPRTPASRRCAAPNDGARSELAPEAFRRRHSRSPRCLAPRPWRARQPLWDMHVRWIVPQFVRWFRLVRAVLYYDD